MRRDHVRWWSQALGRDMELLVYGHAGTPVLVFPTSLGRFFEWEDFGMIGALAAQLEGGHNMLFCVDSVDGESFYNRHVHPHVRIARHLQYHRYVVEEVLPFVRQASAREFLIVAGASFGAYHAANLVFRRPELTGKLIVMGGSFDIKPFMHGHYEDAVYFNNPVDYLPNLGDHGILEAIRRNDLRLVAGEHDICRGETERLAGILAAKAIPHTFDLWYDGTGHDWPWWQRMILKHIA